MTKKQEDVFGDLHLKLADEFWLRMTRGSCDHCGRGPATIQELEALRKFLSDNGITDGLRPRTPLHSLVENLPKFAEDPDANIDRPARTA